MLKLASVATAEDLQRKLAAKMEAMKKEASELLKIAAQSRKKIRELRSFAEKDYGEFTNSGDPSDEDFLKVALNLDRTKNLLVLSLSKSAEDSATIADTRSRYSEVEDDEVIQFDLHLSDSKKFLLNHLEKKLWSISQFFHAEEKIISGMEEKISRILSEVSQLAPSSKNFTGSRKDQFSTYSDKSQQLFGVEGKLERVGFKLVGVFSTLDKSQPEEARKEKAKKVKAEENNTEVRCEESRLKADPDLENNISEMTSASGNQKSTSELNQEKGGSQISLAEDFRTSEDTVEDVSSALEEEEVLSRSKDPNTEVSPRWPEIPVSTIPPVPVPVPSAFHSDQLREVKELQIENIKKELGVYSSFSLSPGPYQALNVFYVDGTPSKFWLSIDNRALNEFNSLLKVFSCIFPFFVSRQLIYCSLEVTEVSECEPQGGRLSGGQVPRRQ